MYVSIASCYMAKCIFKSRVDMLFRTGCFVRISIKHTYRWPSQSFLAFQYTHLVLILNRNLLSEALIISHWYSDEPFFFSF